MSRTLPPYEGERKNVRRVAADFEPWNSAPGFNGHYYGYVNDGLARGGLIYELRPFFYVDSNNVYHPDGEPRLIRWFPPSPNAPPNRLGAKLPHGGMAAGQDGFVYGRLSEGGAFAGGLLFRVNRGLFHPLHHFEKRGKAGDMIVAKNGTLYSATMPEDPGHPAWVFRLSRDGAYRNIPLPIGTISSLCESADGGIIVGMWLPGTGEGTLFRLNEQEEFTPFATVGAYVPHKILPLPDGSLICLTNKRLLQIASDGAATLVWEFDWDPQTVVPLSLLRSPYEDKFGRGVEGPYSGSFRNGSTHSSFFLRPSQSHYTSQELTSEPTRVDLEGPQTTWMEQLFPSKVGIERSAADAPWGNVPPAAHNDVVSANALQIGSDGLPRVNIQVLSNDRDWEKQSLKIVSAGAAGNGVVTIAPNGRSLTYTANTAPVENDTFTYTIIDSARTATGRVFIRTSAAGRYGGQVFPVAPTLEPEAPAVQPAGWLVVNLSASRTLTAHLEFEGKIYRFTGRLNSFSQSAAVLRSNPIQQESLAIQLVLRPAGRRWTVDAAIQKDNTTSFTASALPVP